MLKNPNRILSLVNSSLRIVNTEPLSQVCDSKTPLYINYEEDDKLKFQFDKPTRSPYATDRQSGVFPFLFLDSLILLQIVVFWDPVESNVELLH